jgi:hypothetical protein
LFEAGLTETDFPAIQAAVTADSAPKDVMRDHERWPLIALLKDADGLDRVRLGDLDPRYLRHDEAHDQVDFAHALFDATDGSLGGGGALRGAVGGGGAVVGRAARARDDPSPPGRADCANAGSVRRGERVRPSVGRGRNSLLRRAAGRPAG